MNASRESPLNIVLIVVDSAQRNHLPCYGRRTTPNIGGIAVEGVLICNAYSRSCWTITAHASLFTGRYPSEHRADLDTKQLDAGSLTLAAYLRRRGYGTACVTCNGFVSNHPGLNRGFEETIDVGGHRGGVARFLPCAVRPVHRRWRDTTARDRGAGRATRLAGRWLRRAGTVNRLTPS